VLRTKGPDLRRGPRGARGVALTFHGAGPVALAEEVLALLHRASAPVTVFAVGQWLRDHPDLGHAFASAGHDLGNHTWSHQPMLRLDPAQAHREVQRGADAVAAVLGHPGLLFRPSGTPASNATIRAAAHAAGYRRCISYDVDPADYLDPGAAAVRDRTLARVRPGSIVSLHLGHPGTVAALPGILRGLARRRLEPVTVSAMFAR
jgi:peptidoglycan/xylan/chitin deacetylase (PgdA/CDA1 family)